MYAPEARLDESIPKKVVILRALLWGTLLTAVPALRALRYALPESHITLVSLAWAIDFVKRVNAYLDDFISFPGFFGFPEQPPNIRDFPAFLLNAQQSNFDLVPATKAPSVILFTASDPNRWAPLNKELHQAVQDARTATTPGRSAVSGGETIGKGVRACLLIFQPQQDSQAQIF